MIVNSKSSLISHILIGAVLIIIAILFWPKSDKVTQSNKIDRTKTQIRIKVKRLNIRSEASDTSEDIGDVYQDEIYTVLSHVDKEDYYWYHIKTNKGVEGYIASNPKDEYVEVISGYIDRTGPIIKSSKQFLEFINGEEDFDAITCYDEYSNCTLTYDDTHPEYVTFKGIDDDLNETIFKINYYKVYNLFKEYYESNTNYNIKIIKTKSDDNYLIDTTYSINKIITNENKSESYTPVINFFDEDFQEIDNVYVQYNKQQLKETCMNDEGLYLKEEYKDNSLLKGNTLCMNFTFSNKNGRIKYVAFGFQSNDNYNNKDNTLSSYYSKYFILDN